MLSSDNRATFEEQLARICSTTRRRDLAGLADFFGTSQAMVADAKRRGKVPADWLLVLLRAQNISPEWVLTGHGPRFMVALRDPVEEDKKLAYQTASAALAQEEDEAALSRLPSRRLTDELLRRIALAGTEKFSL